MDIDNRLIFENYKKSKLVSEGFRGLTDLLFGAGRRVTVSFSRATLQEVLDSVRALQRDLKDVGDAFGNDPKVVGAAAQSISRKIVSLITTMAQNTNVPEFRGLLQSIVANYNQTVNEFRKLSEGALKASDISKIAKDVNGGFDEVIELVKTINFPIANRQGFKTDLIKHLTELKNNITNAEKFAMENRSVDRGKLLLLLDWMKANKMWSLFIITIVSCILYGGEKVGTVVGGTLVTLFEFAKALLTRIDPLGFFAAATNATPNPTRAPIGTISPVATPAPTPPLPPNNGGNSGRTNRFTPVQKGAFDF